MRTQHEHFFLSNAEWINKTNRGNAAESSIEVESPFLAGNAIPLHGGCALKCSLYGSGRTTTVCFARPGPGRGQRDPFLR